MEKARLTFTNLIDWYRYAEILILFINASKIPLLSTNARLLGNVFSPIADLENSIGRLTVFKHGQKSFQNDFQRKLD